MDNKTENEGIPKQKLYKLDSSKLFKWIISLALFIIIVVFSFYWFFLGNGHRFSVDPQVWGTFGDYIGGVLNPFFSFLTLISLLYTINLQHRQLEISTQELIASRNELELSRNELEKTANATQNAVLVARETIEAQSRPWLSVSCQLEKPEKLCNQLGIEQIYFRL